MSEVEDSQIEEIDPIKELVNSIESSEFNSANEKLDSILQQKINDSLESEKVSVANSLYNPQENVDDLVDEINS